MRTPRNTPRSVDSSKADDPAPYAQSPEAHRQVPGEPTSGIQRKAASASRHTRERAVEQLEALDPGATIYAAKPWTADARTVVAVEPEDASRVRVDAADFEYFLEVDVALEAATVSSAGTRFERVLYYAENDVFLFDE